MVQLEGRHGIELSKGDDQPSGEPIICREPTAASGEVDGAGQSVSPLIGGKRVGGASSMAWGSCVEEGLVLMEQEVCVHPMYRQHPRKTKMASNSVVFLELTIL